MQVWRLEAENPGRPGARAGVVTRDATRGGGGGQPLVCVRCGHEITSDGQRIEVGGQHEHFFVNPHGYDYHIGCFEAAPGAIAAGPTSHEFTWFPGHTWQLDHCRSCTLHLGWMFRSPRKFFHGLILDRLREADSDQP